MDVYELVKETAYDVKRRTAQLNIRYLSSTGYLLRRAKWTDERLVPQKAPCEPSIHRLKASREECCLEA